MNYGSGSLTPEASSAARYTWSRTRWVGHAAGNRRVRRVFQMV